MSLVEIYPARQIKRFRSTKAEVEQRRMHLLGIVHKMRPMSVRQVFYQACIRGIVEKASSQLDHSHASPSVSGNPHMRLKFCTACDAAPLSRLSITETITARRPPCSSV